MGKHIAVRWREGVRRSDLTATEKLVALMLSTYMNDRGECWPRQGTLADDASLNLQTVRRVLARLTKAGWLQVERSRREGRGTVVRYTAVLSTGIEDTTDAAASRVESTSAQHTSGVRDPRALVSTTPLKKSKGRELQQAPSTGDDDQRASGPPEARAANAIELLAAHQTGRAVERGDVYSPAGLQRKIVADLRSRHWNEALAFARAGMSANEVAARLDNPNHRTAAPTAAELLASGQLVDPSRVPTDEDRAAGQRAAQDARAALRRAGEGAA